MIGFVPETRHHPTIILSVCVDHCVSPEIGRRGERERLVERDGERERQRERERERGRGAREREREKRERDG